MALGFLNRSVVGIVWFNPWQIGALFYCQTLGFKGLVVGSILRGDRLAKTELYNVETLPNNRQRLLAFRHGVRFQL